jgi:hypothetical protein
MMQIFGYRTPTKKKAEVRVPKAEPELTVSVAPPSITPPQQYTHSTRTSTVSHSTTGGASARPLRLVYCDDRGKFKMDPEAVAALQMVKGPMGVVSVCGRARQGKSFILNQVPMRALLEVFWKFLISMQCRQLLPELQQLQSQHQTLIMLVNLS